MSFEGKNFQTVTYGKWILAGEHAVLRGAPALAFPLRAQDFKFAYENKDTDLSASFKGTYGEDYRLLFFGVFEQALSRVGQTRDHIRGHVTIDSSLPVGTGLGASAALCMAVGRWFVAMNLVSEGQLYEFSRGLEDLFHGESSGVDIAVSMKGRGIRFVRGQGMDDIKVSWSPILKLSYCGSKGLTAECISKVKSLFERNPELAKRLDEQMKEAVQQAQEALASGSFKDLKSSLHLAKDCFEKWGLIFGDLKSHIRALEEAGAVAVKPTGSGGGGFVLSLWEKEPSVEALKTKLISAL